jgi:hypothetical protein
MTYNTTIPQNLTSIRDTKRAQSSQAQKTLRSTIERLRLKAEARESLPGREMMKETETQIYRNKRNKGEEEQTNVRN